MAKSIKIKKYCLINKEGNIIYSSDSDFHTNNCNLNPAFIEISNDKYRFKGIIRAIDGSKAFKFGLSEYWERGSIFIGKKSNKSSDAPYFVANKEGETLGEYLDIKLEGPKSFQLGESVRLGVCNAENNWGFIDELGELVIECAYEEVKYFEEGLAVVKKDDKWGIIDLNGDIIVPFNYDEFEYKPKYSDGLLRAKVGEKWGYVDKKGQLIIPAIYDYAKEFSEGLAVVKFDSGKYAVIDTEGNRLTPAKYWSASSFKDGYSKVEVKLEDGDKVYGVIDHNGKYIIKPRFDYIDDCFSNPYVNEWGQQIGAGRSLASVKNQNEKYGLVNTDDCLVCDCVYDRISFLDCGYWKTKLDGKEGLVNPQGKTVAEPIYDEVKEFSYQCVNGYVLSVDNKFFIVYNGNKKGLINHDGILIIPMEYDDISHASESVAIVKLKNRYGLYSTTGEKLTDTDFLEINTITDSNLLRLETDKEYWIANKEGCILSKGYNTVNNKASNGSILFKANKKIGVMDIDGNVITTLDLKYVQKFSYGYAIVENESNQYGLIDEKGNYAIAPKYDRLDSILWKGIYVFEIAGKFGLISSEGKVLTDALYDWISIQNYNYAGELIAVKDNGKWGAIDKNGNLRIEPVYDEDIKIMFNDMIAVSVNGEWGFVNPRGKLVLAPQFKSFDKYGFQDGVCKVESFQ